MANDNKASYLRIGFTVLIGVVATVATLVYLGGMGSGDDNLYAETYYDKSVSGLSVGSPVNFRGVKVGKVARIGFVGEQYDVEGDDNHRIYILMAFPRRKLHSDADSIINGLSRDGKVRASVTASGITGLSRIEIDIDPNAKPAKPITWRPKYPYLQPKDSLLDSFSDSATKVMNQINAMDITAVWSNINSTVESLARTSEGAKTVLDTQRADLERIVDNLSDATASFKRLAAELDRNPSLIIRERAPRRLRETE